MNSAMRFFNSRPDAGVIIGVIVIYIVFAVADPWGWLTFFTQGSVLHYTMILGLLAMGQALVIMCREIDISIGSVYGLTGISYIILTPYIGVELSVVIALCIAAIAGLINAFFIVRLGLSSMIVTVGALFFWRGVIYVISGGSASSLSKEARENWLTQALGGNWFGLENAVIWGGVVAIILTTLMSYTRFGNHLLAVGGDPNSAKSQGIRTGKIKTIAYLLCSLLAGFSAILTLSDQPQTHVTLGQEQEMYAIAAAVIGGTLLTGGRGSIIGALLGALMITAVRYELIALGAPTSWFISFVGVILIVSVLFNTYVAKRFG